MFNLLLSTFRINDEIRNGTEMQNAALSFFVELHNSILQNLKNLQVKCNIYVIDVF